jgi:alkylated DNA repair protein alkB family protein 8
MPRRGPGEGTKDKPQDKGCVAVQPSADPRQLLNTHVYDVYDQIAVHFSHTRYKQWPRVAQFIDGLGPRALVYDSGCGNGKYLCKTDDTGLVRGAARNACSMGYRMGSDRSFEFLKIATVNTGADCFVSDCTHPSPLRSGICDGVISIAVLHHLPTIALRLTALGRMVQELVVGGRGLVYVWAMEQDERSIGGRSFTSQDVYVPWHLQDKHNTGTVSSAAEPGQPPVTRLCRYYHVFTESEFRDLIGQVEGIKVISVSFDSNNWTCEFEKTS